MTCPVNAHRWAASGLTQSDGSVALPCLNHDCADGILVRLLPGAFPLAIDGVPLDILDDPTGGVAKLICQEVEQQYHLASIALRPGDAVLDIGAHVGVVSCYLGVRHPGLRILALEPVPALYQRLVRNLAANGATGVEALNVAVSGDGRRLTLRGNLAGNSGGASAFTGDGVVAEVASVTIEDELAAAGIDRLRLLKIDCEGMEHEVLTDAVLSRVDYLVGEFHDGPHFPPHAAADLEARCVARLGRERVRVQTVRMGLA